ncbi:MAG: SMC family ATPase [Thaumarchaeota archaeon]|nr:SMC family ATPase [Nitrososphaerota archaeon]
MILRKLRLENIRSYKDAEIEFQLGKTLFEGDIGSGKSTILMAIEFALFGLGSEKGAALLRTGASEGKVGLIFEVDGKECTVTRGLSRKRNAIQQTEGVFKSPEESLDLSPTELKEKVLEALGFNEPPDPKAQSVIYRYAVFTPQEEMKTILLLSADLRLQTLRKAFRIEDYKTAADNARELSNRIRMRSGELDAATGDLLVLEKRIEDLSGQVQIKQQALEALAQVEQEKENLLNSLKSERNKLQAAELELSAVTAEIAHAEKTIGTKKREIENAREEVKRIKEKSKRTGLKVEELEAVDNPTAKSQEELKKEIKSLEKREKELRKVETQVEAKIGDYESIRENMRCPTCDRPADPAEFEEKIKAKKAEREDASNDVNACVLLMDETRNLLEKKGEYDIAQDKLGDLRKELDEYEKESEKWSSKISSAQEELEDEKKKLGTAKVGLERLKETSKKLRELEDELETVEKGLRKIRDEISAAKTSVKDWNRQIEEYGEQVKEKKERKSRAEALKEYRMWIDDYFLPSLGLIERNVMLSINQDFNSNFQKWFGILVEDPEKEASVDEDFTPLISQDGYEQDVRYLSGGEKTSVGLAYRLALNTIVQKVATGMRSNLLILDEPTDGFSKEQLGKVREILDEIQSPQIIIVSHEKELESFADQIYVVSKHQGESKIIMREA